MSLYNMLNGMSPLSGPLLGVLGLSPADVGRFRDVFVKVEDGEPIIGVHTRNGGGNRSAYQDVFETLAVHPLYLRDEDEEHDCTYATIWFRSPPEVREKLLEYATQHPYVSPKDRFEAVLASLKR